MKYQVMPDLTPIEYEALKADIAEHGVLVPVEVDENGDILDGHHRVKAWQELTTEGREVAAYPSIKRVGWSEEQKRNHARRLNVLRRQLTKKQREQVMIDFRKDGLSYRQIADAVGVDHTTAYHVAKNAGVENSTPVVTGKDGKKQASTKKVRQPSPPQQSIFSPGGALALDPKAVAQTVKDAKQKKRDAREENRKAYSENGTIPHVTSPALHYPVTVYNKDARSLADYAAIVHLVITSPPYNVGIEYDEHDDNLSDYIPLITSVWSECYKAMVGGGRIAVVVPFGVGRNPYVPFDCQVMQTLIEAGFTLRGRIVWDKGTTGNRTSWGSYRMATSPSLRDTSECIIVAHKGDGALPIPDDYKGKDSAGTYTTWLQDGDYFMELAQDHWIVAPESAQRVGHPAPFPTELVRRLIHFYGFPGCHVIDPFGGSGTVGVVAKELGCQATLFDISQDYCRLAEERIHG